jgi:hypothetical protein
MKSNKSVVKEKGQSPAEMIHEALDALKTKLSEALGDHEHNVLETIKFAASKVIHKAEKDLDPKSLKKAAKKAIKAADKVLKGEKKAADSKSISPGKGASKNPAASRSRTAAKKAAAKKTPVKRSRSRSSK